MKPKDTQQDQSDLFRARLDQILDRTHPLFVLANRIDWSVFDKKFGAFYSEKGRPGKPTRLPVGKGSPVGVGSPVGAVLEPRPIARQGALLQQDPTS